MRPKEHISHAMADISWREEKEVGRKMPPPGSTRFAATARLKEDDEAKLFSVILYYPLTHAQKTNAVQEVELHFLAPKLILPRLKTGSVLYITDGPKIIAEVQLSVVNKNSP